MLSDRLTRVFARVILASYVTQLLAPVVQATEGEVAMLPSTNPLIRHEIEENSLANQVKGDKHLQAPIETQPVETPLPLKTEIADPLPSPAPHQHLPTLSIRLDSLPQNTKGRTYRLSAVRTIPIKSGVTLTDFQWQKDFFFSGLRYHSSSSSQRNQEVHFPLIGSLNLNLSESGQLTAFSTIDSSGSYQAYNYRFHLDGDLHLANLMTNGRINVKQAHVVSAEGEVYGQEGIFLKGDKEIRTRSKDTQHPTHLHSKKRISIKSPYLDNENSCIQAPTIKGKLGRMGQRGASLDNTNGVIEATDVLSLSMATEVFNEGGVLNASSGKTKVSIVESLLNKKGFVGGKRRLDLTVKGRLQNPGGKLRSEGKATVEADSWFHAHGAEAFAKNLDIIHTRLTTDLDIIHTRLTNDGASRLGADDLLRFTLPQTQQAMIYPISTHSQLEIDREGNSPEPLHLLANLIAKKGLKVRIPEAPLIVGAEEESQPMVKLQAENGFMDIQSKSLDIVKAQLFSRIGMRWEVQEKQIHIGRGVVSEVPIVSTYKPSQAGDVYFELLRFDLSFIYFYGLYIHGLHNLWCDITSTYPYPFTHSNGTMVITEGPFTAIAPPGILIDQAEIHTKNWDITTEAPVRNEGGRIAIQGGAHIHSPQPSLDPTSCLQNILLTRTDHWMERNAYNNYTFTHHFSARGEITVGGDLNVGVLEDVGGLVSIGGQFLGTTNSIDFAPTINPDITGANAYIQERFPSQVSSAKGMIAPQAKNPTFEGVLQSPLIVIGFEGKAMVGRMANYQRQATPPFQQMKVFMDIHRSTAMFHPVMNSSKPWVNQPSVPLSWNVELPPAVGLDPNGLYLLDPTEKLLLHPLQEVGDLPSVFAAQLRRGYLDEDHPDALATYIMGRHQAYTLYQKFFAPKVLEEAPQDRMPADNPERVLRTLDTTLAHTMTEEEISQLKFMMLYYGMPYEGKTVHLPVSWLSKHYDDPRVRNPDGGVFASRVAIFKGKTPNDILHCVSTIHGEQLLGIDVPLTIVEQQSLRFTTHHINTITKKGSWGRSDKVYSQGICIHHNIPQPGTGILSTGDEGQMALKGSMHIEGGSIKAGKKGLAVDMPELRVRPNVKTTLGYSHSSAGGTSVTQFFPVNEIQPVLITSDGGIKGPIRKADLTSSHMITYDKDINLNGKEANFSAHRVMQNLGTTVTKEGRAVTITERSKEIAVPCMLKAHKGNVLLDYEDRLHGEATQFLAEKKIGLISKDINIETLLMKAIMKSTSTAQGMFSKQTTDTYQESPEVAQSLFVGDEVHFHGEQAKIGGAYIKTRKIFDHTEKGFGMHSTIKQYYSRQETKSRQPLASSKVGMEGGQAVRVPTTVDADAIIRLPEGHVLLTDGTIRRVQKIPGDDNACGFASLLWHLPGFDPLIARDIGVGLLLEHLNSPTLQNQICSLIAPEIMEWALIDSEELFSFPDADIMIPLIRQAQKDVTKAVRAVNSALNLTVTLTAKKLLAGANELESIDPNAALIFAPLRKAQERLEAAKAEIIAWANDPAIVREYVRQVVGQPGWMLGYGSEYDGSPGAMDALVLTLGVNLHVYRDKEGEITLVHAHETHPHARLVELLHTAYRPREPAFANHFDRLEAFDPNADTGKMTFEDTVINDEVTKIIGNYEKTHIELTNWSRSWAEHHQAIPNEALVVVALAITIATQGAGASLLNGLSGSLFGTVARTSTPLISLTATGASMASAAFTAVCTQAATSFLSHGDLAQTGKDLLSSQGIRALGTAVATAGLIGDGGSMAELSFGQRLAVNGFRSMVRASVSSAIEKRNIGDTLKDGGIGALVDTISGSLAQSIGEAALAKDNPLTFVEHKVAHFALGAGMGAALDHDHPLTGAVTGGLGAMMGEVVGETLVDRPQIEREVLLEMKQSGQPFSIKAYNAAYREKLQPYINTARLVVGSTIAAMGHNPSIAIAAATNALENNFALSIVTPSIGQLLRIGFNVGGLARQALTTAELNSLYEKVGVEGIFLKLVEDGVIQVRQTRTGVEYTMRDETFSSAEGAWRAFAWEASIGQSLEEKEWVKGRTLQDIFGSTPFQQKVEALAIHQGQHGIILSQKKSHKGEKSGSVSSSGLRSGGASGAMPPDGREPKGSSSNEKKEVLYPNNPTKAPKSFEKVHGGKGARQSKSDNSVWEKDNTSHGGDQWKMWKTRRSWEKGEEPASIWPDGRVRKWGDQ